MRRSTGLREGGRRRQAQAVLVENMLTQRAQQEPTEEAVGRFEKIVEGLSEQKIGCRRGPSS